MVWINVSLMISLFVLLFAALFLSFVMDLEDGSLDGFVYMFSIQPEYLAQPETWINGLSQSAWSCSAGMGMAITYSVYMRKDEDTTLNAATMCLANPIPFRSKNQAIIAIPDKRIACRNISLPKKNENGAIGFIYVLLKKFVICFVYRS